MKKPLPLIGILLIGLLGTSAKAEDFYDPPLYNDRMWTALTVTHTDAWGTLPPVTLSVDNKQFTSVISGNFWTAGAASCTSGDVEPIWVAPGDTGTLTCPDRGDGWPGDIVFAFAVAWL